MTNYNIDISEWVKHVARKRSLFISLAFTEVEGKDLLFNAAGIRLQQHLYTYKNGISTQYRTAKELDKLQKHFLGLVEKNDPRLVKWKDLCIKYNKRADELIQQFKNTPDVPGSDFPKYYEEFLNILLYGVTLPFLVLSAIDSSGDVKKYQTILDLFAPTRGVTKYPELEKTMLTHFWKLAAKLGGVDDYLLLTALAPAELKIVLTGKKILKEELQKRNNGCVFWSESGTGIFSYDQQLLERLESRPLPGADEVKGKTAFPGKVSGKVCIVNSVDDMKNFKQDDILVSISTNPSLMPVLKKCKAIVTDEGGVMSHAAIISRELKKPCVIGAKTATKVFKDGDLVEVDAEKGSVKKIN